MRTPAPDYDATPAILDRIASDLAVGGVVKFHPNPAAAYGIAGDRDMRAEVVEVDAGVRGVLTNAIDDLTVYDGVPSNASALRVAKGAIAQPESANRVAWGTRRSAGKLAELAEPLDGHGPG